MVCSRGALRPSLGRMMVSMKVRWKVAMLCNESLLLRSQWARLKSSGGKELAEVILSGREGRKRLEDRVVRISGGQVFLVVRELRNTRGAHYLTCQ